MCMRLGPLCNQKRFDAVTPVPHLNTSLWPLLLSIQSMKMLLLQWRTGTAAESV